MNTQANPTHVAKGVVVSMDYVLKVDGEIADSSEETDPIEFLQGYQNIIPGLERAIEGMKVGESKDVTVAPEDGYGEVDPNQVQRVPRDEFPEDIPAEAGVELEVSDEDGEIVGAMITEVTDEYLTLDFNHPLAGKTLNFHVKIVELRAATEEELEHGHVHGDDSCDDDCDCDCEDCEDCE